MGAETELRRTEHPIILPPNESVMNAARAMHDREISAVLVADEAGKLVGIFTGRDAISRVLAAGLDPVKTRLSEVMSYNPLTISPPAAEADAVRMMQQTYCRHLPIVNGGNILGLISRGDFRATSQP